MLILASQSPRRSMLLAEIGVDFEVIPSLYEEKHDISKDPIELAMIHACGKAEEVYLRFKDRVNDIVLGVDTLVTLNNEIFGKPKDMHDASAILKKLSGQTHQVISALCLIRIRDGKKITHFEKTDVTFGDLTGEKIAKYIQTNEWQDKAGGYAIQGAASDFIVNLKGDLSNVIGLPQDAFLAIYNKSI